MGSKETNYKKILLGLGLAFGMILVATIIAVAAFFISIPEKHSSDSRGHDFTAESSPDSGPATTPGNELQSLTGSQFRDPFLPPAIAWSNLKTVAIREPSPKAVVSNSRTIPNTKKPKAIPVKRPTKTFHPSQGTTPAQAVSPEPADPNTPEFKEILILPGLSQGEAKDGQDKSLANGLKINYKVKKGETLSRISVKFGVSRESITKENGLSAGTDKLPEGKVLIINVPNTHLYQLKANETLWRIASRYGTTVELLQEINNIQDLNKLKTGQNIILPVPVGKN
jgi:LysM repeat protein